MNYLENKTVYLCGAIKQSKDDGVGWRDNITPILEQLKINVSDPCKKTIVQSEIGKDKQAFTDLIKHEKWDDIKELFWPVVRYDLRCVDKADFIIFNYDPDVQTVGSIHELVVANFEKKPILLKYDKAQLDKFNPWIATFIKSHHFFDNWDKLIEYLDGINSGKLDSSYWIL